MTWSSIGFGCVVLLAVGGAMGAQPLRRYLRRKHYTRGRQLTEPADVETLARGDRLWGGHGVSKRSCRQHMIVAGTSGSGKSLLLRRTLKDVLLSIEPGTDRRILVCDTENDVIPYLKQIGVTCPVLSLNPLESRSDFPIAVRWDVSRDITNPARALNLAAKFVPLDEGGGNSKFFSDAARLLIWAIINSFNRHSPRDWSYSDLVYAALSAERITQILSRDTEGCEDLAGIFRDAANMNVTADNIFSTLYSKMAFHKPVAALWQRTKKTISMRDWVQSDSILLLGIDETMEMAFDLINGMVFQTFVEEVGIQSNSDTRETILWLDELRACNAILKSGKLNNFLLRMRKKGGVFMGGFQDIEGFRHAIGSKELANEIIGQCSHKALLRLESSETAQWASELLGKFETIDVFETYQGLLGTQQRSVNEQRVLKDNVLPSEFFAIPEPSPDTGVMGYFLSPGRRPYRKVIEATEFNRVVVDDRTDRQFGIRRRDDADQELLPWTEERRFRLGLELDREATHTNAAEKENGRKSGLQPPTAFTDWETGNPAGLHGLRAPRKRKHLGD